MVEPLGAERTYRLVRVALAQSRAEEVAANAADLDRALTSLDGVDQHGNTDHDQLRDEIKARFATSIDYDVDENGDKSYEVFVNKASEKAVDQGYAETVLTRTYRKIVSARATIGTAPDMAFEFLGENGEDNREIAEMVSSYRDAGKFRQALVRADRLSVALGSSVLYVRWLEGRPRYQAVPPQNVFAKFADQVESNGELRAVDTTDIDDATCIGVRLPDYQATAQSRPQVRILLYAGRSTEYPQGRCCVYTVDKPSSWADAPPVGATDRRLLEEYTVNDEPANPLTVAQDQIGIDEVPTEYPIAIFLGQDASADLGLFPTNGLALWRDTTEFDIAYSRTLSAAVEGARGLMVVDAAGGTPLPRCLSGAIAVHDGASVTKVGHEAAGAAVSALQVLEAVSNRISNAYCVPAYMMTHDGTQAPQSGYSLDVQNMPLENDRRERVELNRAAVERIWHIERGLLTAIAGEKIPPGIDQKWTEGTVNKPIDRTAQIELLARAQEKKYIDYVTAVRRFHNFATDAEAIDYITAMNERPPELAGPSAAPAQPQGLRALAGPPPRPSKFGAPPQQNGGKQDDVVQPDDDRGAGGR